MHNKKNYPGCRGLIAAEPTNPELFVDVSSSSSEKPSGLSQEATFERARETETSSWVFSASRASNCSLRCFFVRWPPTGPFVVVVPVPGADAGDSAIVNVIVG